MNPADDALAEVRRPYDRDALLRSTLGPDERDDPLAAVRRWVEEAVAASTEVEPTAEAADAISEQAPDESDS